MKNQTSALDGQSNRAISRPLPLSHAHLLPTVSALILSLTSACAVGLNEMTPSGLDGSSEMMNAEGITQEQANESVVQQERAVSSDSSSDLSAESEAQVEVLKSGFSLSMSGERRAASETLKNSTALSNLNLRIQKECQDGEAVSKVHSNGELECEAIENISQSAYGVGKRVDASLSEAFALRGLFQVSRLQGSNTLEFEVLPGTEVLAALFGGELDTARCEKGSVMVGRTITASLGQFGSIGTIKPICELVVVRYNFLPIVSDIKLNPTLAHESLGSDIFERIRIPSAQ